MCSINQVVGCDRFRSNLVWNAQLQLPLIEKLMTTCLEFKQRHKNKNCSIGFFLQNYLSPNWPGFEFKLIVWLNSIVYTFMLILIIIEMKMAWMPPDFPVIMKVVDNSETEFELRSSNIYSALTQLPLFV